MLVFINLSVFPPRTGIFTTAGGVITRAEACNVFNSSTALFALYNLDEAFSASPATYRDEMLVLKAREMFFFCLLVALLKIPLLEENSFKTNVSFAPTLDLNYHLESFYVSRRINVN